MTTETSSSCPECNGVLDASDAETTCMNCGLIVTEDWIDPGPSGVRSAKPTVTAGERAHR